MNDTNKHPTETFIYKFHDLGEEMTLEETPLEIMEEESGLQWVVKVFGRLEWSEETHAQTLEQPAEHRSQDEFDHVELTLELDGKIILRNEEWTEWDENRYFDKVKAHIDSIDWSVVY